ncbi:metal-dependent hydrolase [Pseudomonas sp. CAU 1711]|uniref:metal-dependent hydrolase n=1 Tax=Pseudomonas sp. CAU 1711 TaxID=3140356 RepID=UPI003260A64D
MFIAHAPSGYLLGSLLQNSNRFGAIMLACIAGAVAPDLDLLYFYLLDGRQTHHHRYFSHWPLLWLGLTALACLWRSVRRHSTLASSTLAFALAGVLHMLLDSLVGDIWWLAPFRDQAYALFSVPNRYQPWWLNFLLHWTFIVELAICLAALMLYLRRRYHTGKETSPCPPSA